MSPTRPAGDGPTILVVDDDDTLREAIARYLTIDARREVRTAADGETALGIVAQGGVSLMLLDIRMPGTDGFEIVPQALAADEDLGIVMLSGIGDAASAARCLHLGALDYLTKPIELSDLASAVERGLQRRATLIQKRSLTSWARREAVRRSQEATRAQDDLERVTRATLEVLVNTLEAREPSLSGHSHRVASLAATVALELGLSEGEQEDVRIAGRLHDLGKIGLRQEVLRTAKTAEDRAHFREHVRIGSQILAPIAHLDRVREFVASHHEHWDGTGYPLALTGEQIPIGGRILRAVEIFDTLTTRTPERPPLSPADAVARLRSFAGTVLDPDVVEALELGIAHRRTLESAEDWSA